MTDATDSQPISFTSLGWRELGRYYVFLALIGFAASMASSGLELLMISVLGEIEQAFGRYSHFSLNFVARLFFTGLAMIGGLYFALGKFSEKRKALGFRRFDPHWLVLSIFGWAAIIGLLGYGLSEFGRNIIGEGAIFGHASLRERSLGLATPKTLIILVVASQVCFAAISETTDRGLVFNALRNLWDWRLAALAVALIGSVISAYAGTRIGAVPIFSIGIFGSLFNCWLFHRSRSILPGMIGIVGTAAFTGLYLSRF